MATSPTAATPALGRLTSMVPLSWGGEGGGGGVEGGGRIRAKDGWIIIFVLLLLV